MMHLSGFVIIILDKMTTNVISWHQMDTQLVLETQLILETWLLLEQVTKTPGL